MHLIRFGDENAQPGPVALRAVEIHEKKTRLGVTRLISLPVPAITFATGAAVAGIVASLVPAMLALNELASQRIGWLRWFQLTGNRLAVMVGAGRLRSGRAECLDIAPQSCSCYVRDRIATRPWSARPFRAPGPDH